MVEREFGPYRLVRQIAVGGMAEIHLAKTNGIAGFEKYVALKMIHPNFAEDEQFIQMLVDEAKIAVQLNHGNIAQTFDLGRVGDTYYITMEFVDGADLYKILRRASEIDVAMPLDVCAFVVKEIAQALDHAHRKRDHHGKPLGIIHRDVSPQNVLISFSGEVKLVDFGIAKATMKARQTAVGVIKGKYYYMSPEQAWGDPLDARSDIFSAGIVLYEMLTGQMLYLEEDLHKLLDMARKAEIASPRTLRKDVPPQLERIVMRALAKTPADRYRSAADFASDLERFLHAYSPVFTAAKVAQVMKQIIGDPETAPSYEIELRDGPHGTLNPEVLIHDKSELHDENSVIFRVDDLQPKRPPTGGALEGRITRQSEIADLGPPPARRPPTGPSKVPPIPKPPPAKPRQQPDEQTRETGVAPVNPNVEDSGLLNPSVLPPPPSDRPAAVIDARTPIVPSVWDSATQHDDGDHVEHTLITGAPSAVAAYLMEDGVDATLVTSAPQPEEVDDGEGETLMRPNPPVGEDEGPTVQRDFREQPTARPAGKRTTQPAPPALAAKIQAPAVSELRRPRASRKTPASGVAPAQSVLQAIVGPGGAPMPSPREGRSEDSSAATLPGVPSPVTPQAMAPPPLPLAPPPPPMAPPPPLPPNGMPYDASGLPLGVPTPPQGQPYMPPHGYPQMQPPPQMYPNYGYPQVSASALAQLHPFGVPTPPEMSITGQMRMYEADEIPPQYKVRSNAGRNIKLVIAGTIAVTAAASTTFFIMRATRETPPQYGSIHVDSMPPGAQVFYDDQALGVTTPTTIDKVPVGSRHAIRVELARYKPYSDSVDVPKQGGEVAMTAVLKEVTGKLVVLTHPDGAEIWINGTMRGRAPTTITDIDMRSAKKVELRLKDYQPYSQDLVWPASAEIEIDKKLQR